MVARMSRLAPEIIVCATVTRRPMATRVTQPLPPAGFQRPVVHLSKISPAIRRALRLWLGEEFA